MANGIVDGYEFPYEVAAPFGVDYGTELRVDFRTDTLNLHGVISGATGTGKSRTIQTMIEFLSERGIATLLSDGKGDMSGLATSGELDDRLTRRTERLGQDWWEPSFVPVEFLALGGNGVGTPLMFTVGSFGQKSLAKLTGMTPQQTAAFANVYRAAAGDSTRPTETLSELCAVARGLRDDPDSSLNESMCSRLIDRLETFDVENPNLFGGPEFDIMDLIRQDDEGYGFVSVIDSSRYLDTPDIVNTSVIWILDQLIKNLPEVGNKEMKLVTFIDEAHTLFEDGDKEFIKRFRITIKKLRSKGVGVILCTQNLSDIPEDILSQCGLRIQHAIRVNTAKQRKKAKETAETFPDTGDYNILRELTAMPTGRALISIMDEDGFMTIPACCDVFVPRTSLDPITDEEIAEIVSKSDLMRKHRNQVFEREERERARKRAPIPFLPTRSEPLDLDMFEALRSPQNVSPVVPTDDDDSDALNEYESEKSENIWG